MEERKQQPHALQWHPAFYAGIQIELEAEADLLLFENEHQLGTKPKEIDVLIVKKERDVSIRKNIGRIFRTHNIVEYKSPKDYLSVDDFYKVYGYPKRTLLNQSQESCADHLLRQYHLAYPLYASIYFLVK